MKKRSSSALFTEHIVPKSVPTGKSLAEKLEKLEKKLKKKELLRSKIDPSMYSIVSTRRRITRKGHQSYVGYNRRSVLGNKSSGDKFGSLRADSSQQSLNDSNTLKHTPAPPSTKRMNNNIKPTAPSQRHRKLSLAKDDDIAHASCDNGLELNNSKSGLLSEADGNSKDGLSPFATNTNKKSSQSSPQQLIPNRNDTFSEKVKKSNKNCLVEIIPTTQYYSSPDKLCKTTSGNVVLVNGNLVDDPSKKYYHPVKKEENISTAVKKSSDYVGDIMRIGLSNKELIQREKQLIKQKKKLGIPKEGYIEGIRKKNRDKLFEVQKQNIVHRQKLNRYSSEFRKAQNNITRKGIDAARKRELDRPLYRKNRLNDISVEDSIWRSKVMTQKERDCKAEFDSFMSMGSFSTHLQESSHVSDFKHIDESNNAAPSTNSKTGKGRQSKAFKRMDSAAEKEHFDNAVKSKVLETTSRDIQSITFDAHTVGMPVSHSEVSPRAGEQSFLANKSRFEDVMDSKEIQYLEEQNWIVKLVDLIKGLASERKNMSQSDKEKTPATPNSVFVFMACSLRIILAGVTIDKNIFYQIVVKVFSQHDLDHVIINQVISFVRRQLKIEATDYRDYLVSVGIEVMHHTDEQLVCIMHNIFYLFGSLPTDFFLKLERIERKKRHLKELQ